MRLSERIDKWITQAQRANSILLVTVFVLLLAIRSAFWFDNVWVPLATVVVFAGIAFRGGLTLISPKRFQIAKDIGLTSPIILSVCFAVFAVYAFGAATCSFERLGWVEVLPSLVWTSTCPSSYADIYFWYLLDSIPLIKFTETIGWQLSYTLDLPTRWIVVVFKIVVIIPVVASFVNDWRFGHTKQETSE